MKIDIRKIKNGVTEKLDFDYEASLADYDHFGEKIFANPIKITGNITNKLGVINLFVDVKSTLQVSCGRCLTKTSPNFALVIDNVLSLEPLEDDFDDTFVIKSTELDLDEIILPAVMLEVSMNYLCDENCKGLCPKCGADLNQTTCSCDTRIIDPRLEVLKKLLD